MNRQKFLMIPVVAITVSLLFFGLVLPAMEFLMVEDRIHQERMMLDQLSNEEHVAYIEDKMQNANQMRQNLLESCPNCDLNSDISCKLVWYQEEPVCTLD